MGNLELVELRQTSATIWCPTCLKHVPEGLNMCLCGVWLRPNQETMDRFFAKFAALITPYYRATIPGRGRKHGHNQWQKIIRKPLTQNEEQRNVATILRYSADGRTMKCSELFRWRSGGLKLTSSTSTTSSQLTSSTKRLTAREIAMKHDLHEK